MNNPYEDILPKEQLKIGRPAAWILTVVFLLAIVTPPVLRNLADSAVEDDSGWVPVVEFTKAVRPAAETDTGIAQRLREFETKLEQNTEFADSMRRRTQSQLTSLFHEGNNRTVIGRDGWLYFRPALQALTGYGPITPEPSSVAKDPSRSSWKPALKAITRFADQLKERGVELVLVPAPVKPMIYPEYLSGSSTERTGPVRHKDSAAFFNAVRDEGVTVIDIADSLWQMKDTDASEEQLFLKQDTHWRPRGMEAAADAIAAHLQAQPWYQEVQPAAISFKTETATASHIGDLVEKLDLPDNSQVFEEESVTLTRILDTATGEAIAKDSDSPVVILGDSFVNIFHDPGLGFATGTDTESNGPPPLTGAGLAQHLAMKLGWALDVIAINGEASSGVREQFARRYDDEVRAKKAVVWVIAARDLFLSETPAKGIVRWDDVTFNTSLKPDEPIVATSDQSFTVDATVTMKSAIPNPRDSSYKNALYVIELGSSKVVEGELPTNVQPDETLYVKLWAFQNGKYSPTSNLTEGKSVRLKLSPWDSRPELHTERVEDDTLLFDPVPWWFGELAE